MDAVYTAFDAFVALLRRWKLLVFLPLAAGVVAVAIGFALPKWYRAEAQILPPYSKMPQTAISSFFGGLMGLGGEGSFTLPMMVTPVDLWSAMVKSPGIADSIIEMFDLMSRYKCKKLSLARKAYATHLYVDVGGEGILTVGYEDKDPRFAAEVTNAIVDLLDRTLLRVRTTSANRTRRFLEERLAQCSEELAQAGEKLAEFQKAHRAISLEDQARVAVENIAQLYGQLAALEVQLGALRAGGAQFTPEFNQLEAQAKQMRRKISELELKGDTLLLGIPLKDYPDLILEYARLYRDLKIQELLYEMLKQQYEQARIEEQRNVETLNILARAVPPDKKIRPKKAYMGIGASFATFVVVALWCIWRGYLDKLREADPERYKRLTSLWRR